MNPRKYLDNLFISKVRIKALRFFIQNPDQPIHLRAAVRELNEEINAVRRELERMEKINLVLSERKGNRKYFQLNKDFLFYDELLGMVYKTFGLGSEIITGHKKLGNIKYALLTQGITRNLPSGKHQIDLVVIGEDVNLHELRGLVEKEEKRLNRDIHYTVLPTSDFEVRKRRHDTFVQEVFMQDFIMLIGNRIQFISGAGE